MNGALCGVRVLDLSRYVAGAYCGKLLSAFGAEVIKVEQPGTGDPARQMGPFPNGTPNPEASAPYLYLNTGKRGLTLDLKQQRGVDILKDLIKDTDILIENFAPCVMPALNLDYRILQAINPKLIMVSISNFGQSGPYRDYKANSMIGLAMGGYMFINGAPDRQPLSGGGRQPAYQGALHGYSGAMAALLSRECSERGQHVDISIQECMTSIHQFTINRYVYVDRIQQRIGNRYQRAHPICMYPCADGLVSIAVSQPDQYQRFLEYTDTLHLLDDPRFATTFACSENTEAFDEHLAPWMLAHGKDKIVHGLQERRVPVAYVNDMASIMEDPQYRSRGFWHEIDHPVAGTHSYAGLPVQMSGTPPHFTRAPLLGEHTDEILGERLGFKPDQLTQYRDGGVI
ncbi:MAG: CoA transferase [Rhodospirillaceae bacterium]|jgi:CoA:oxalate CoA-transferase|nr:CoA transferase [Rhodospirillaceae bacterium]MBT4486151.1 CoA transferase [Rhodospirillaceae bacterium]MBT5192453.1 CoA transferase [Rhodospirillaceae bacterium]MBT5898821.1 CoA transferase [Rhodospirillaceae bacterium]MBT6430108.1 CoA transferase [Rhodospirillaceae bacterium]